MSQFTCQQYLMLIAGADIVVMGLYFFALHAIRQTQGADPATRVGPELEVNYERSFTGAGTVVH